MQTVHNTPLDISHQTVSKSIHLKRVGPHLIYLLNSTIQIVYDEPAMMSDVKGIFFIAHACTHSGTVLENVNLIPSALDFWLPSERCIGCLGLSEEGLINMKLII